MTIIHSAFAPCVRCSTGSILTWRYNGLSRSMVLGGRRVFAFKYDWIRSAAIIPFRTPVCHVCPRLANIWPVACAKFRRDFRAGLRTKARGSAWVAVRYCDRVWMCVHFCRPAETVSAGGWRRSVWPEHPVPVPMSAHRSLAKRRRRVCPVKSSIVWAHALSTIVFCIIRHSKVVFPQPLMP